jgi:GNAT superfamily N-acetyltransferase
MRKSDFKVRKVNQKDRGWIKKFIAKKWGSEKIISRGKAFFPYKLSGFLAVKDDEYLGLITYHIEKDSCQIISLDSIVKRKGIGTNLIEEVKKVGRKLGCRRIWLITTNDNIDALCFWQKIGFSIKAVYPDAVTLARRLKPQIPLIGNYGIPIRDEIKLEVEIR